MTATKRLTHIATEAEPALQEVVVCEGKSQYAHFAQGLSFVPNLFRDWQDWVSDRQALLPARGVQAARKELQAYLTRLHDTDTVTELEGEVQRLRSQVAEVPRLQSQLARIREQLGAEIAELRDKLTQVCERIEISSPADRVQDSASYRWIEEHQDEVEKHRGRRIAVHPQKGIVASGSDYAEVAAEVRKRNLGGQVLIASVPEF